MKQLAIIFPAYNEEKVIVSTVEKVRTELSKNRKYQATMIIVDDGSQDATRKKALACADVVLFHRRNRGLGAALATGIEYVKRKKFFDYCLTFDSDGQHNPKDIFPALNQLEKGMDIVVGSRFLSGNQSFPKYRKIVLYLSNIITYLFFQVWTTDSQSGFRALNQNAINRLELKTNRMEVSSEFFYEIKRHHLHYGEIPITIAYTTYSMAKGQSNLAGVSILIKLIYKLFH